MSKKVSLIIPIYNEEKNLPRFLPLIDRVDIGLPKQIVMVDDCSTDKSAEIIGGYPFTSEVKLLRQANNGGKGAALRAGFAAADGEIIGVQDADFEYDPREIAALLQPILNDRADIVFGSRFRETNMQVHRTYHFLINKFLTLCSNLMSGLYLTDMETCYKFFRSDIIKNINLKSDRFGFEPEVTAKIARLHLRVSELPISYYPRTYLAGKKITWKDGVAALRHIIYFNAIADKKQFFKPTLPDMYKSDHFIWL